VLQSITGYYGENKPVIQGRTTYDEKVYIMGTSINEKESEGVYTMAKISKEQILEAIANMTVLEVSELVKDMEEKFGVTAAAPLAMVSGMDSAQKANGAPEASEEKTEFTIILKSCDGGKKIPVIKEVKAITGLGLKDAKELVEAGNKAVKEDIPKEEAEKIKERLETAGGIVEIQ
jgi:large subunit ribosomal protein L7/L12